MKHVCALCKKEFEAKTSNRKYCSMQCFRGRNKQLNKRTCLNCSKEFNSYPNWIKRGGGKFCSHKCHDVFQSQKIEKTCKECEKNFLVKPSTSKHNASKYCSPKCGQIASRGISRPSIQGDKHPNWRGGSSFYPYGSNPYPSMFNDSLKEKIRNRDNYECQICGVLEEEHISLYGFFLQIHHIDYIKANCIENNLITVCCQCHGRTNYNRDHWESKLSKVVKK